MIGAIVFSGCGTSMELHTSHSTDREIPVSMNWNANSSAPGGGLSNSSRQTDPSPHSGNKVITADSSAKDSLPTGPADSAASPAAAAVPTATTSTAAVVSAVVDSSDTCCHLPDGTESRGSTSPKSYDSVSSSIEDKVGWLLALSTKVTGS